MKVPIVARWLFGAALSCAALSLRSPSALAVPRDLLVVAGTNTIGCQPADGSNDFYYSEVWGWGVAHTKSCEAMTVGGSAMASCAFGTSTHQVQITRRAHSTLSYVSTIGGPSAEKPLTSQTDVITKTIPASSACLGGLTINATSVGYSQVEDGS